MTRRVRLTQENFSVSIVDADTGESLASGIICLAFAESYVLSQGWELVTEE